MMQKAESSETDEPKLEQAIRDPFVLEFLDLKDEYSESGLEEAFIQNLADFLLELGDDFRLLVVNVGCELTTTGLGSIWYFSTVS